MNNEQLRRLAGIDTPTLLEKKWSDGVKVKVEIPEGLFDDKSSSKIAKILVKLHDGDAVKAMQALNFYVNRAGKNLSDERKVELGKVKEKLSSQIKTEEINFVRKAAGLPLLEKKKTEVADDDSDDVVVDVEDDVDGVEEELPKIVLSIAKKAVGKDEEALAELLKKVYDAGHADGMAEATDDIDVTDKEGDAKPAEDKADK